MPTTGRLKRAQCILHGRCQRYCGTCHLKPGQHRVVIRGVSLFGACIDWGYCICNLCAVCNYSKRPKRIDMDLFTGLQESIQAPLTVIEIEGEQVSIANVNGMS